MPSLSQLCRRTVRDDADLVGGTRPRLAEQALRGAGHDDDAFGLLAELCQNVQLVARRLRQDGVQRHDEWLRQLPRERENVLPVLAAEDAVLVLKQHDVDVEAAE